jgi:thymus-specific serine protease
MAPTSLSLFLPLLLLLPLTEAFFESRRLYASRVRGIERRREAAALRHDPLLLPLPQDNYFPQPLDHFSAADNISSFPFLQQRWWGNAQWWNGSGPVFVYVEGETSGSPYDVLEGEHCDFAAQYGALVLALEHRFYGKSIPLPGTTPLADLSTPNLRFLSSHQAVADLGRFLTEAAMPAFNFFTPANRIVTFGGSYPGVLSAHARLRLPHLVHAALASSAPVENQLDYGGYNDVVGLALSDAAVNGSSACLANLSAAFAGVAAAFAGTAAERHAMAARLRNCGTLDGTNDTAFALSEYSNVFKEIVQGNGQWWMAESVGQVCGNLTAPQYASDPVQGLVDYFAAWLDRHYGPGSCYSTSYQAEVAYVSNVTTAAWAGNDMYRQWLWQLCSQFAQGQTCDADTACPFAPAYYPSALSNAQTCVDIFGAPMTVGLVEERVDFTNSYLGGRDIQATRVIYVNGGNDPWSRGGRWDNGDTDPQQPSVLIAGASHCQNMISAAPSDSPAMQQARKDIAAYLAGFMAQTPAPTTTRARGWGRR